jgi:tripartite ATP-independent transporter DctM subunit
MENKVFPAFKVSWLEKGICYGSLALLTLIPFVELILRRFNLAIPDSKGILTHIFLVLGFFAAMLTAKTGEHIAITAVQLIKKDRIKHAFEFFGTLVAVFLLTILAWNCVSFIKFGLMGKTVGILPAQIFAVVMPLGYTVMALRLSLRLQTGKEKISALAAFLVGTAAALPAIAKIIWGFDPPEPFFSWVNMLYDAASFACTPAVLFLIIAALCGMPIFAAIGGIAMIILQAAFLEPEAVPIQVFDALTNADIIAIPLFTLTGFFLSESRAGERLVRTFRVFFSWLPGGMIVATVIICAFFTSFTGASGVTILALGGILYTILTENKYTEKFSIGLLTSVGSIGLMFPPSLPIILVAATSGTILHFMNVPSEYGIVHYFIGAIIPGLILVLAMISVGFIISRKIKVPVEKFEGKKALASLRESFFEILLPIILILGYFSGRLTLLEASAVSVIYVVIVEVFVNKDIAVIDVHKVFAKAIPIIGGILAILAMAKAISYAIIDSGLPENFTIWMKGAIQSKLVFLLLLNLALILAGFVMDIFSAILVLLPLVVPLAYAYGINPVHMGIIFIMNLEAGFLTPPVGLNLFLASYRFERPFGRIFRYVMPFLLVQFAVVLLITYVPVLTTWLTGFFK